MTADDNLVVLAAIREARRVDAELEVSAIRHPSMFAVAGTPLPVAAGGRARRRPLTGPEDGDGGEVGA